MPDLPLPISDRPCPKCGHDKAYGPEYRRGFGKDTGMGEHLRYYCAHCRYMTVAPTRDTDTPTRRRELTAAFERRTTEWTEQAPRPRDTWTSSRRRDG